MSRLGPHRRRRRPRRRGPHVRRTSTGDARCWRCWRWRLAGCGDGGDDADPEPVDRVLIVTMPGVTWSDVSDGDLPNLEAFVDHAAIGDVSTRIGRPRPHHGGLPHARRRDPSRGAARQHGRGGESGGDVGGVPTAELLQRRLGTRPPGSPTWGRRRARRQRQLAVRRRARPARRRAGGRRRRPGRDRQRRRRRGVRGPAAPGRGLRTRRGHRPDGLRTASCPAARSAATCWRRTPMRRSAGGSTTSGAGRLRRRLERR